MYSFYLFVCLPAANFRNKFAKAKNLEQWCSSVVEHLASMYETLDSIHTTTKKQKQEKKKEKMKEKENILFLFVMNHTVLTIQW
jgi:hypothetical protein